MYGNLSVLECVLYIPPPSMQVSIMNLFFFFLSRLSVCLLCKVRIYLYIYDKFNFDSITANANVIIALHMSMIHMLCGVYMRCVLIVYDTTHTHDAPDEQGMKRTIIRTKLKARTRERFFLFYCYACFVCSQTIVIVVGHIVVLGAPHERTHQQQQWIYVYGKQQMWQKRVAYWSTSSL